MCLAFAIIGQHQEYPLVLLFNRDEDYVRATKSAHWWEDSPHILGGRDLLKGGTWAGITREGRFAMLTFIRVPREAMTPARYRGEIVPEWLSGTTSAEEFLGLLQERKREYLGYNILLGTPEGAWHYNNHSDVPTKLEPGVHGVSNADLNTPWYKVRRGLEKLPQLLPNAVEQPEIFLELLADSNLAPDDEVQVTGLNPAREKLKSALFIRLPDYGTLSSTVVSFHRSGQVHYYERSYAVDSARFIDSRFTF